MCLFAICIKRVNFLKKFQAGSSDCDVLSVRQSTFLHAWDREAFFGGWGSFLGNIGKLFTNDSIGKLFTEVREAFKGR